MCRFAGRCSGCDLRDAGIRAVVVLSHDVAIPRHGRDLVGPYTAAIRACRARFSWNPVTIQFRWCPL
jgi:hypothetical protein